MLSLWIHTEVCVEQKSGFCHTVHDTPSHFCKSLLALFAATIFMFLLQSGQAKPQSDFSFTVHHNHYNSKLHNSCFKSVCRWKLVKCFKGASLLSASRQTQFVLLCLWQTSLKTHSNGKHVFLVFLTFSCSIFLIKKSFFTQILMDQQQINPLLEKSLCVNDPTHNS